MLGLLIKAPLAIEKAPLRIDAVPLFVCLSVVEIRKKRFFSETKQFKAFLTTYGESFSEPVTANLKIVNYHISTKQYPILMKFGTKMQIWNSMTVT